MCSNYSQPLRKQFQELFNLDRKPLTNFSRISRGNQLFRLHVRVEIRRGMFQGH